MVLKLVEKLESVVVPVVPVELAGPVVKKKRRNPIVSNITVTISYFFCYKHFFHLSSNIL